MAKPTVPFRKITANPSQLVDCPPPTERTRLGDLHEIEEGQSDMKMMHSDSFLPAQEVTAEFAMGVLQASKAEPHLLSWGDAMASYLAALAVAERHDLEVMRPIAEERDRIWGGHVYSQDPRWAKYDGWRKSAGYHAAAEETQRLWSIQGEKEQVLLEMPAPHGAALLWKLERLFGPEARETDNFTGSWAPHCVDPFFDDIRRWAHAIDAQSVSQVIEPNSWNAAMSEYLAAKVVSDAEPSSSDQSEALCDKMVDAEMRLLKMPAPDLRAVEWKLLSWQEHSRDCVVEPSNFDDMLADVRRLSADGWPSRPAARRSAFIPIYDQFMAAWLNLNNAPGDISNEEEQRLGDIYIEAFRDLVRAHPSSDREFRLKFLALWTDGGAPDKDITERVIADAQRLAAL